MNAPATTPAVTHAMITTADLVPHPDNPRIEPRQDIVDQLAERMASGFDPAHALIVRPIDGERYQIISGHHRLIAAEKAGISELPCWVRDLNDEDAYMQLVLCNTQSELHPLEEGKHAAESGMDLKAYAEAAGKSRTTLTDKVKSYRVLSVTHVRHADIRDSWRNLAEIHAAPQWLWAAMVARMLEGQWTVATTRQTVGNYKGLADPPEWADLGKIASNLLAGQLSVNDLPRFRGRLDTAAVKDEDLTAAMRDELQSTAPSLLSEVQQIISGYEGQQADRDATKRKEEAEQQQQQEEAQQRVARLRKNCSLDEWKGLSQDEQSMLLLPTQSDGGVFNRQKNEAIEWAQWSWNPVTGCKHDCPYCYARDIALGERMKQGGHYPNGWEPTFRSAALNAPRLTKVPKEAGADTRYRNVFTCSMADLFGRWVPDEWISAVLSTVRDSPEWNFLFLTKFPQRFKGLDIPDNAWMGTTVDMQARVKNAERAFEGVGGKVKWLSVEPMIEPLHFDRLDLFDWIVIGGASRSDQTPAWEPPYRWIEDLVRQADDAKVPVYMKTNLGIANRVVQLPFSAPVSQPPQVAPDVFHYLGKGKSA